VKSRATVKLTAKSPRKKTVRVTVSVRAPYTTPTGKVQLKRGKKVLKTVTLKKGKATITVRGQAKGRKAYTVVYVGSAKVTSASKSVKVRVR